ncbi:MAG: hypothetical protein KAQ98_13920 [Bacteriovoracaceae bacterium]|nr:hypothetical protein [Bacteriovoracaceae bacterium]
MKKLIIIAFLASINVFAQPQQQFSSEISRKVVKVTPCVVTYSNPSGIQSTLGSSYNGHTYTGKFHVIYSVIEAVEGTTKTIERFELKTKTGVPEVGYLYDTGNALKSCNSLRSGYVALASTQEAIKTTHTEVETKGNNTHHQGAKCQSNATKRLMRAIKDIALIDKEKIEAVTITRDRGNKNVIYVVTKLFDPSIDCSYAIRQIHVKGSKIKRHGATCMYNLEDGMKYDLDRMLSDLASRIH